MRSLVAMATERYWYVIMFSMSTAPGIDEPDTGLNEVFTPELRYSASYVTMPTFLFTGQNFYEF